MNGNGDGWTSLAAETVSMTYLVLAVYRTSLAHPRRSRLGPVPLHRRLAQLPPHPGRLGGLSPDEYEAAWHQNHHQEELANIQPEPAGAR